jgi:Tol biopolymer transport system component
MAENGIERLESWKEIASFIGRDQRTAMRWAKEQGMPVRRDPASKRGRVFAYRSELAKWADSRSAVWAGPSSISNTTETDAAREVSAIEGSVVVHDATEPLEELPSLRPNSAGWRKKQLLFAVSSLLLLGMASAAMLRSHASGTMGAIGLIRLTDDGRHKRNLRSDGRILYFNEFEGQRNRLFSMPVQGGPVTPIGTPFANAVLQDVSRDGRELLVTSPKGVEAEPELWIVPLQGDAPRRVGQANCVFARWSPDNRAIACGKRASISLLKADGSTSQTIGTFRGEPCELVWSPDGKRLRFTLAEGGIQSNPAWELVVGHGITADRVTAAELPLAHDCCSALAWTKDGEDFLYAGTGRNGESSLSMIPDPEVRGRTTKARSEIPIKIGQIDGIVPGKTGRELYLLISNARHGELLKFSPKERTFETFLPSISAMYISFSRDGRWISYMSTTGDSLWRSKADGTDAVQLTTPEMEAQLSAWSPDGRQIAFTGKRPGQPWRIFLVNRDGGPPHEASTNEDNQGAPSWSPDGKSLVYANVSCSGTQACGVRQVDLSRGTTAMLPDSQGLRTARWSPDGRRIAALQPERHEVVLLDLRTGHWRTLAGSVTGDDIHWSHDSRYVYVDSPLSDKPVIDRVRIRDGQRTSVVSLSSLQTMPGWLDFWFGLPPDDSPILLHYVTASDVYALEWAGR